jgi:hypothetical protein
MPQLYFGPTELLRSKDLKRWPIKPSLPPYFSGRNLTNKVARVPHVV